MRKKIPFYYLLLLTAGFLCLVYSAALIRPKTDQHPVVAEVASRAEVLRRNEGKLVQPLVMTDVGSSGGALKEMRGSVESYIREQQAAGNLLMASVSFRDLSTAEGFEVNRAEQYLPGSIMKLPILITYLKESELHPGLLDQRYYFKQHYSAIPEQTLHAAPLAEHSSYTVRELLEKMIVDSDNDATALLNEHIDLPGFMVLFRVLGLRAPDTKSWDYFLTAGECSRFLRVLFDVTYLDEKDSEYAMELLTRTKFSEGFTRDRETIVLVAHKFGERNSGTEQQLHETGIFYLDRHPYLLTVMAKGADRQRLPGVLTGVSRIVMDARHRGA